VNTVFFDALVLREPYTGVAQAVHNLIAAVAVADPSRNYRALIPRTLRARFPASDNLKITRSWLVGGQSPSVRVFYEQFLLPFRISSHEARFAHFPAYVAPRMTYIPFVLTIHDLIAFTHPLFCKGSTVKHFATIMPRNVEKASRICVPSEFVKRELLKQFSNCSPGKVSVVPFAPATKPSGVTRKEARRVLAEKYGLDKPYFLFVGNLEIKKNLPTLLRAFFAARMRCKFPHMLVLAGRPGFSYSVVRSAYEGLAMEEMLFQPGFVPQEDLPLFYRGATALCFPSLVEGFGLPVLEALQEGTPCLLSDIPPFRELAGDCATYVPMADLVAWREAIERIVDEKLPKPGVEDARVRRASGFTWERTARATMSVYKSLEEELL